MIGWLLSKAVPWKMRRLRCPEQGEPSAAVVTGEVMDSFLLAAEASFRGASAEQLFALEEQIPWNRRPFFWEGHGFGVSGRLACAGGARNSSEPYVAPGFRYMLYTGLGVWNGIAAASPFPAVNLDPARWEGVPDFQGCRVLVAGGASFSVVSMHERVSREDLEPLCRADDPYWTRGIWQGAGRAAWFLYMRNPARLTRLLEENADRAEWIAEGVGLAITYTQLAEPDRILEQLDLLPARWRPSLQAGNRLCLAAAARDDLRIVSHMLALPEPLRTRYQEGSAALASAGSGPDMPERLLAALYTPV